MQADHCPRTRKLAAMILGIASALAVTGCAQVPVARDTGMAPEPRFAAPCHGADDCDQFAPCALKDFSRCRGFRGVDGLRQEHSGTVGGLDFRAQATESSKDRPISLWHDLPLVVSDSGDELIVNAFFEISRGTQAKLELNKWEAHNPIWQDRRPVSGQAFERPRYYAWSPAPGNYGALPRTWENVLEPDPLTGLPGDTDPIDVISVSKASAPLGIAAPVKVIGALGMIDGSDRQTDWKIVVIHVDNPMADEIDDIADVPQRIKDEWALFWRFYKTATGHAENFFYAPDAPSGFSKNATWLGAAQARTIVRDSAKAYRKLVDRCLNRQISPPYWVPGCRS